MVSSSSRSKRCVRIAQPATVDSQPGKLFSNRSPRGPASFRAKGSQKWLSERSVSTTRQKAVMKAVSETHSTGRATLMDVSQWHEATLYAVRESAPPGDGPHVEQAAVPGVLSQEAIEQNGYGGADTRYTLEKVVDQSIRLDVGLGTSDDAVAGRVQAVQQHSRIHGIWGREANHGALNRH